MAIETIKPERQMSSFRLWHLLYLTTLFGTGIAVTPYSILFTVMWLMFCWAILKNLRMMGRLAGTFLFATLMMCFFGPTLEQPRGPARFFQCRNNQRQLMIAMWAYHDSHGQFPNAVPNDNPPVSWRIRLLPYLDHQRLYDQYNFSEPWDGPSNSKLATEMPYPFQCPSCQSQNKTVYKLLTGPGTLFDGVVEPTATSINDGTSNTIAIVEDNENPVEWMKPEDISIEAAIELFTNRKRNRPSHQFHQTFSSTMLGDNVALFDGSTHVLNCFSDPRQLNLLFGINNGLAAENALAGHSTSSIRSKKVAAGAVYLTLMLAVIFLFPIPAVPNQRPKLKVNRNRF